MCSLIRKINLFLVVLVREINTINPRHGYIFKKHGNQNRINSSKIVKKFNNVIAPCGTAWYTNKQVECK